MKPENRALLAVIVAVLAVTAVVGGYLLLVGPVPPTELPLTVGVSFTSAQVANWTVHFTVGPSGGTLVGGWTMYNGFGYPTLWVVNGTVSKPDWGPLMLCPLLRSFAQLNGSVDDPLPPGPYTAYWTTGFCASAAQIVITQTVQVVPM